MLSYFFLRDGLVDDIFEAYCKATYRREANHAAHCRCCGSMLQCSMSGFVSMTAAASRTCDRSLCGTSPS